MAGAVGGDSVPPPEGELTRRALSGLTWTYGATAVSAVLQIGYTVVMGRLLDDRDFGLIAMAQLFVTLGQHLANAGVGSALVQKASVSRDDIRVAITSSLLLGLLFGGAVAALAPLAGAFYETPRVVGVLQVLAVALLLQALGLTPTALLRRELAFRRLAVVTVVGHGVGYLGVGIALAVAGAGVWSLVGAIVSANALTTVLAYAMTRHSLVPLLRRRELAALYGYGGRMSVIDLMEFVGISLDTLLLGRFGGQAPLGQYNRASLLITLPITYAVEGLSQVLFPAFSLVQADIPRLRRGYLGALRMTAALVLPMTAGIAAAAAVLVPVLLGPGWEPAAAVLPLLALVGAAGVLAHFGGVVCDATAELDRKLALQAGFLAVLAAGLWAVRDGTLIAFAAVVAGAHVLRTLLYMGLMRRVLGVRAREYVAALLPAAATAAGVAAAIAALGRVGTGAGVPAVLVLLGQIAAGAVLLLASLRRGPLAPVGREVADRVRLGAGDGGLTRLVDRVLGTAPGTLPPP